MVIGFQNFSGAPSPFATIERDSDNNVFDASALRNATGSALRQRHMRERENERQRELMVRMREGQQLERLNEQISSARDRISKLEYEMLHGVKKTFEVDGVEIQKRVRMTDAEKQEAAERIESMRGSITMTGRQIDQIHANRTQREEMAVEREALRQKAELEEQVREQEERLRAKAEANRPEPQTEEELEQAIASEKTRSLTMIGARMDNIRALSSTRASLQAEATMLENEVGASQMRQEQWNSIREGREIIRDVQDAENLRDALANENLSYREVRSVLASHSGKQAGRALSDNPEPYNLMDGFHGRQIQDLNMRVSRLDMAIASEINAKYREVQALRERMQDLSGEQAPEYYEEENGEENGYAPIDVIL